MAKMRRGRHPESGEEFWVEESVIKRELTWNEALVANGRRCLNDCSCLGLSLAAILVFAVAKVVLETAAESTPTLRILALMLACLVAWCFRHVETTEFSKPICVVLRGLVVLFVMYLVLSDTPIVFAELPVESKIESRLYTWGSLLWGVLGWWRVAWVVPLFVTLKLAKGAQAQLLGVSITPTDYTPLVEVGLLLAVGTIIHATCRPWWRDRYDESDKGKASSLDLLFLTALAVHFSNYFYSGLQKLWIGEHAWDWVLYNPTYYLTLAAWEIGSLPLTILGDDAAGSIVGWLIAFNFPLNVCTLLIQIMAVVTIIKVKEAMLLTVVYDVMHVVIFSVTGIFFYKWIWLNVLLVIGLNSIRSIKLQQIACVWLVGVVLLAPTVFFVAFLGWFDTPSFDDEHIEAVAAGSESYRVPTNYFLSGSVTHAQQRLIRQKPGHFGTDAYGTLHGEQLAHEVVKTHSNCELQNADTKAMEGMVIMSGLSEKLNTHQRYVESVSKQTGFYYHAYPHHIFTMPWEYRKFDALDKTSIRAYKYVVESKCLRFENGMAAPRSLRRFEYTIPVTDRR